MKCHRHSTVLEWHAPSGVVSYIHFDRVEVRVHQGHVVNVSEPIRYRVAVTSANRWCSQQRRETVTHYARFHDVRVDVYGIKPARHAHHVVSFVMEGVRITGSLVGWRNHAGRWVNACAICFCCYYTGGLVTTDLRNPNMGAVALWYGMVNTVFGVMCNVIF